MSPRALRYSLQLFSLVGLAAALGLAYHRFHRTPEQTELTRYVEVEVPALLGAESVIEARLEQLSDRATTREQARELLVSDVIPRLIRLRRQAESVTATTRAVSDLHVEYTRIVDQLTDACRACVRVIDDASLSQESSIALVRERFADVHTAYAVWNAHVRATCAQHHLAPVKP